MLADTQVKVWCINLSVAVLLSYTWEAQNLNPSFCCQAFNLLILNLLLDSLPEICNILMMLELCGLWHAPTVNNKAPHPMTIIIGWQLASSALLIQLPVKRLRSSLGSFTKSEGGSDADGIGGIWDRDQFCECARRDIPWCPGEAHMIPSGGKISRRNLSLDPAAELPNEA